MHVNEILKTLRIISKYKGKHFGNTWSVVFVTSVVNQRITQDLNTPWKFNIINKIGFTTEGSLHTFNETNVPFHRP
jgi:hypothetical protein